MTYNKYKIIGAATGWGAQLHQTEDGAITAFDLGISDVLKQQGKQVTCELVKPSKTSTQITFPNNESTLPLVLESIDQVNTAVTNALQLSQFPIVIGGDHSIAIGTWAAVGKSCGNIGLIWVDAHMDSNTFESSPSKAYHGMPLACLMGHGLQELTSTIPVKIKPENVVLIGIRSYESGEERLLESLGVRIFKMPEINSAGIKDVFAQAIKIATTGTDGFGLSIDLDAFDPNDAPGVGSPEINGLHPADVLPELHQFKNHPDLKAFEIAEFNPHRDKNGLTATLMFDIIKELTKD